jgi:D-3-phosphoglycerate dehydrogenase
MRRVLLSKEINPAAMALLDGKADVTILSSSTEEAAKNAVVDAEAVVLRTNVHFTRGLIAAAKKLKLISRTGVGVDNVDVAAATERGIMVCNTPGVNTSSVAEQTLGLMLALAKRIRVMDNAVREGNWKIRNASATVDVHGTTLGLVGVGAIGAAVGRLCARALEMNVIAFDPYVKENQGITLRPRLEDIFREADFVSIHVPYTSSTHHLVDGRMLSLMKRDAYLINTARGAVVDEKALADALSGGHIAGAGLDVLEEEPPKTDNPLLRLGNVVLTPHVSALTRECEARAALMAVNAVVDYLAGRQPLHIFNKDQLMLS